MGFRSMWPGRGCVMGFRSMWPGRGIAAWLIVLALAGRADAGFQLITNGDFESGLSGWTTVVQPGGVGGWYSQMGSLSPLTSRSVQAPPGPTHAAMSDGYGSQVLYQDFLVPQGGVAAATLSFERAIANQDDSRFGLRYSFNPLDTLDYTAQLNRQARVDILTAGADPFSVRPGDVLQNLYRTETGDPDFSGYTTQAADVTALLNAHAGQTLRLRFAEVNSLVFFRGSPSGPLNFGVDLVSLDVSSVPEPMSLVLLASGGLGLASYAWRKRKGVTASPAPEGPDGPGATLEVGP